MAGKKHWLFKTEPAMFSIQDLRKARGQTTRWDGVRNYQARNLLRDEVRVGDGVLFYHSSTQPPAIVGIAEVVREGYPDPTAWDPHAAYFDPKSQPDAPTWYSVDVRFVEEFPVALPLPELRKSAALQDMVLLRKGMRLSIQPVTAREWTAVQKLAAKAAAGPKGS